MSLINDALKRANEAKPPPEGEVSAPPLRPTEEPPPRRKWLWIWYTLGLVLATFLASWAIIIGVLASQQLKANQRAMAREIKMDQGLSAHPDSPAQAETNVHAPIPAQVDTNVRAPVREEPSSVITNREVAASTFSSTNAMAAVSVEPPKHAAPVLKLQGIFYRPAKPAAMINSKLLKLGDKIFNAKVIAIDQESVTLEQNGQTLVLTLP